MHHVEVGAKTRPSVKTSPQPFVDTKYFISSSFIRAHENMLSVFGALRMVCQQDDVPVTSNKPPVYSTVKPEPMFLMRSTDSLSTSHNLEVLEGIVCRAGSCCILTGGKAMTHSDGLSGQFHKTLVQATETAFLWTKHTHTHI